MKKIIALCTATVLCLSLLSGCFGGNSTQSEAPSSPAVESEAQPSAPSPAQSEGVQPTSDPGGDAVDLAAFAQAVQENHEFHSLERADPADEELGAIMLENSYPGLKDMDLEQLEVYLAMISFSGGELALVQAKSPEDAAKVESIFQARIDAKSTDGPGNYPEEVEMWQRSAKVVTHGNYVMLVNHQDSEAIASEFNALFS